MLDKALDWAATFIDIPPLYQRVIKESKKSFLFTGETPWVKKGEHNFDVAMGAFDGAETCDLIGIYLLNQLMFSSNLSLHTGKCR